VLHCAVRRTADCENWAAGAEVFEDFSGDDAVGLGAVPCQCDETIRTPLGRQDNGSFYEAMHANDALQAETRNEFIEPCFFGRIQFDVQVAVGRRPFVQNLTDCGEKNRRIALSAIPRSRVKQRASRLGCERHIVPLVGIEAGGYCNTRLVRVSTGKPVRTELG